ncbi:MAG: lysophospholipid acyltransferase family protein [Bacilli bacterium]
MVSLRLGLAYVRMYYSTSKYKKKLGENLENDVVVTTKIAYQIFKDTGVKIQAVGMENIPSEQGVMYVANHQSSYDIYAFFVILQRQLAFIAKEEFRKYFNIGYYIEALGGILIDRDDIKSQVKSIRELTKKLQNGYNVGVYPEGTRRVDGTLGEFKSGTFKMALKSKCKIVPITFFENYNAIQNKKIKAIINKAIAFEEYEHMSTSELSDYIKNIIQKDLDEGFDETNAKDVKVN